MRLIYMNIIDKMIEKTPDIFYDKWIKDKKKNKLVELYLFNFTNPDFEIRGKGKYYVFKGYFIDDNYLEIIPKEIVNFWFGVKSFENEIVKRVVSRELDKEKKYDLQFKFTRISDKEMYIKDATIKYTIL